MCWLEYCTEINTSTASLTDHELDRELQIQTAAARNRGRGQRAQPQRGRLMLEKLAALMLGLDPRREIDAIIEPAITPTPMCCNCRVLMIQCVWGVAACVARVWQRFSWRRKGLRWVSATCTGTKSAQTPPIPAMREPDHAQSS